MRRGSRTLQVQYNSPEMRGIQRPRESFSMISRDEVARIAHLARLELTPDEAGVMQSELNAILGMVDRMAAVDTAGVEPMAHPQEAAQRLREDRPSEPDQREAFQAVAPAVEAGLYLVPQVIE